MAETDRDTSIQVRSTQPGCFITLVWFILVGWWLSSLWVIVAWVLIVLIVTMPIGLIMLNKTPLISSLQQPTYEYRVATEGTATRIQQVEREQHLFLLRAMYFVLVGWWLSALWVVVAHFTGLTLILLPISIWMYNRVPAITTLKRY